MAYELQAASASALHVFICHTQEHHTRDWGITQETGASHKPQEEHDAPVACVLLHDAPVACVLLCQEACALYVFTCRARETRVWV